MTFALFDKEVKGSSETLGNVVPYTNNGVTKDVTVLRPENQGKGYVRGGELAWNGFFDFLPGGAGISAHARRTRTSRAAVRATRRSIRTTAAAVPTRNDDYPLEGLSERSTPSYILGAESGSAARVQLARALPADDGAANLNIPAFADDYGQLDASVSGSSRNMSFGMEAVNLIRSKFKTSTTGHGAGMTYHNWVDSDRRYTVYLRASF